ncbi:MAG: toll/interleukin-1 receptor domain-containing protein [Oscillospiraceae bacterium]|nr:toll/interleukin-1 receptor domain-containing protein [Oscillospiraceae bacterium]
MNCDVKAYDGKEPFIFISYAHDDAHMVYPIVERLVMDGYRVWYDDGIHAGEDWTETVAMRLDESAICMPMLTENYVQSVNCRNELAYSLNSGKTVISIKLTDFEMPRGLKLQMGNAMYLERYRYGETEFYERLGISHGVSTCRAEMPRITDLQLMAWRAKWENATPIKRAQGELEKVKLYRPELPEEIPANNKPKKSIFIWLTAGLVVLIAVVVILLPGIKKDIASGDDISSNTYVPDPYNLTENNLDNTVKETDVGGTAQKEADDGTDIETVQENLEDEAKEELSEIDPMDLPKVSEPAMLTGTIMNMSEALTEQFKQIKQEYSEYDISDNTVLVLDSPFSCVDENGNVLTFQATVVPYNDVKDYFNKRLTILGVFSKQDDESFQTEIFGPYKPEGYKGNGLISWNPYGPYIFFPYFINETS